MKWSKIEATGDIPLTGRHGHSACEYKNSLLVFGGQHRFNSELNYRECLNDLHRFDLSKSEWAYVRTTGDNIDARRNHCSIICDDNMYVYGGINADGKVLKDVWSLNLRKSLNQSQNKLF